MNTSFLRVALIAAWGFMRRSSLRRVSRQLAGSFPGLGMELRFRSATGISPGGRSRSGRRQFLSVSCGYTPFRSVYSMNALAGQIGVKVINLPSPRFFRELFHPGNLSLFLSGFSEGSEASPPCRCTGTTPTAFRRSNPGPAFCRKEEPDR